MHVHSCMQKWPGGLRGPGCAPGAGPGTHLGGRGQRCALLMARSAVGAWLAWAAAGRLRVAKSGWLKSNMVIRLPIAGLTFGTYAPGVAFGRLSSLTADSGDSRQLASMNFRTE